MLTFLDRGSVGSAGADTILRGEPLGVFALGGAPGATTGGSKSTAESSSRLEESSVSSEELPGRSGLGKDSCPCVIGIMSSAANEDCSNESSSTVALQTSFNHDLRSFDRLRTKFLKLALVGQDLPALASPQRVYPLGTPSTAKTSKHEFL